jgi:hypothetical protein
MAFTMAATMAAGNRVLGGGEVARPCLVADRSLCSELVRAEAGQRSGDGADDVSDDDDGAGDGAGEDRAIEPEGPGLGDQHGLGTCAEAETSVSTAWVGAGSMQSAPLRATPGKAQKRAAGLLLTSVGWARLQGGMVKGGQGTRGAQSLWWRRAEEGLCWRRGGGANLRMHIMECLLRQALSNASEDAWKPARGGDGSSVGPGGCSAGGAGLSGVRAEGARARARGECVCARAERACDRQAACMGRRTLMGLACQRTT